MIGTPDGRRTPHGMDVLYVRPAGNGWGPIHRLVRLAGDLLGGTVLQADDPGAVSTALRLLSTLPSRPGPRTGPDLLVIAPKPIHLAHVARLSHWLRGYRSVQGWVIDSFWTDQIPRVTRTRGRFDQLWITDADLVDTWRARAAAPVGWLPWGADVLGAADVAKTIDVQRVGRQPEAWDDDEVVTRLARQRGLRHLGRPAFGRGPDEAYRHLCDSLAAARVVLAFSNRVAPADYTHPHHDYLTGRWTDALAHGCLVAGATPAVRSADALVPSWARIEVDPTDPRDGIAVIADRLHRWTPELSRRVRTTAARQLDWRHRLATIVDRVGVSVPALRDQLTRLPTG